MLCLGRSLFTERSAKGDTGLHKSKSRAGELGHSDMNEEDEEVKASATENVSKINTDRSE